MPFGALATRTLQRSEFGQAGLEQLLTILAVGSTADWGSMCHGHHCNLQLLLSKEVCAGIPLYR